MNGSCLDPAERAECLKFVVNLAREAGDITLRYFRNDPETQYKADRTPVTVADRESEELIRSRIQAAYPTHGILGEEHGLTRGSEPLTWVVDPIDGTKSFVLGIDQYAVLIALVCGEYAGDQTIETSRVEVGVIHIPPMRESVSAARGHGSIWTVGDESAPARVSEVASLADARVGTTDFADLHRREPEIFDRISRSRAMTRTWGDAYGYLLVATGRYDAMIDPIMNPWDIGPLPVIVEEAGGRFTNVKGQPEFGGSAVASNGLVHRELLDLAVV